VSSEVVNGFITIQENEKTFFSTSKEKFKVIKPSNNVSSVEYIEE